MNADPSHIHRPHDRETLRAAAVELRQRGLTPLDIGIALELGEDAVRELLGLPTRRPLSVQS